MVKLFLLCNIVLEDHKKDVWFFRFLWKLQRKIMCNKLLVCFNQNVKTAKKSNNFIMKSDKIIKKTKFNTKNFNAKTFSYSYQSKSTQKNFQPCKA